MMLQPSADIPTIHAKAMLEATRSLRLRVRLWLINYKAKGASPRALVVHLTLTLTVVGPDRTPNPPLLRGPGRTPNPPCIGALVVHLPPPA